MSDNKSLTYLMQLEENTKSEFTEVKNKIDSIDLSIGDLSSITSTINTMQGSILSMKNSIDNMYSFVNETNIIVKDILKGSQISEWVDDLITFGESSTTYNDPDRMTTLVEDPSSCKNADATDLILKWAAANNKTGTYFGNLVENTSITWSSLTTPASVMSNENAFKAIAEDANALARAMNNTICKTEIYNQRNTTQKVLQSDTTALNNIKAYSEKLNLKVTSSVTNKTWNGKYFVLLVHFDRAYNANAIIKSGNSTIHYNGSADGDVIINKFADYLYLKGYYTSYSYYFNVVDFA